MCFCSRRAKRTSRRAKRTAVQGAQTDPEPVAAPLLLRSPTPAGGRHVYVIFRAPCDFDHLVGVHYCAWRELAALLPGGKLCGPRVQDCKRFASALEADQYFRRRFETAFASAQGNGVQGARPLGPTPLHFHE